jgi:hypothetical protein
MLVDPRVFLFAGNRQGNDIALGQFGQRLHGRSCLE